MSNDRDSMNEALASNDDEKLRSVARPLLVQKNTYPVSAALYEVFGNILHCCNNRSDAPDASYVENIDSYVRSMKHFQILCTAFEAEGYALPFSKHDVLVSISSWWTEHDETDRTRLFGLKELISQWIPESDFRDPLLTIAELWERLEKEKFKPAFSSARSLATALRERDLTPHVAGGKGRGKSAQWKLSEVKKALK